MYFAFYFIWFKTCFLFYHCECVTIYSDGADVLQPRQRDGKEGIEDTYFPIFFAANEGDVEFMKLCVERGADIKAKFIGKGVFVSTTVF